MTLYLAQFTLRTSAYMGSDTTVPLIRLVRAEDAEEARHKVATYYESRSDPHGTGYMIDDIEISEVIE